MKAPEHRFYYQLAVCVLVFFSISPIRSTSSRVLTQNAIQVEFAWCPGSSVKPKKALPGNDSAVEALRRGARDYLPKPFTPDQIRMLINRGRGYKNLRYLLLKAQRMVLAPRQSLSLSGRPSATCHWQISERSFSFR